MPNSSATASAAITGARALRVGFLALTDAAPLIAAQELGLYARHGLEVSLRREIGWATIREKIIYGEANMPTAAKAATLQHALGAAGLLPAAAAADVTLPGKLFREDLHTAAHPPHRLHELA